MTRNEPIGFATTPPGEAGIAVFRFVGPGLTALLAERFAPRGSRPVAPDDLRSGTWRLKSGVFEDCVIRTRLRSAPPTIDVAVHGGIAVAAGMAALPRDPTESSAVGAAAAADRALDDVESDEAVRFLIDGGARLDAEVRSVADVVRAGDRDHATARIDALLVASRFGRALIEPPIVAIVGAVNAGKSTLFNTLIGTDRAIASSTPGTTRDVVEETWIRRGFPFRLRDSAGVRPTRDPIERAGVERALKSADEASIVVRVYDAARRLSEQDCGDLPTAFEGKRVVSVVARADAATGAGAAEELRDLGVPFVACSATRRDGIDAVADAVFAASPFAGPPPRIAPFLARQVDLLEDASAALARGDDASARTALSAIAGAAS